MKFWKVVFFVMLLSLCCGLAGATDYYVSTTGNNEAVGSEIAPWATIAYGVSQLQAGDTLFVRGGTYTEDYGILNVSGTAENPIFIKGYPGEVVTLDGNDTAGHEESSTIGLNIALRSYVHISNINIINCQSGIHTGGIGVNNLSIDNVTVRHTGGAAIGFASFVRDSIVKNSIVEDNGWNTIAITGNAGDGNLSDPDYYTHNLTVENCTLLPPFGHSGVDLFGYYLRDIYIKNNTFIGNNFESIFTHGPISGATMEYITVDGNRFYNTTTKTICLEANNSIVKNNILNNVSQTTGTQAISLDIPVNNITYENNTITNSKGSAFLVQGTNLKFYNNSFNNNSVTSTYDIRITAGSAVLDGNLNLLYSDYIKTKSTSAPVSIQFSDNRLFKIAETGTFANITPEKSIYNYTAASRTYLAYPVWITPTSSNVTVSDIIIDTTAEGGESVLALTAEGAANDTVDFVLGNLTAGCNYTILRDSSILSTETADENGEIAWNNSEWSEHTFYVTNVSGTDSHIDIVDTDELYTRFEKVYRYEISNFTKDYQVFLNVSYDPEMQTDFRDIRFVDGIGENVSYWIQDNVTGEYAETWLRTRNSSVIYLCYGNDTLSSESSINDTMEFGDEFIGTVFDSQWTVTNTTLNNTRITGSSNNNIITASLPSTLGDSFAFGYKIKPATISATIQNNIALMAETQTPLSVFATRAGYNDYEYNSGGITALIPDITTDKWIEAEDIIDTTLNTVSYSADYNNTTYTAADKAYASTSVIANGINIRSASGTKMTDAYIDYIYLRKYNSLPVTWSEPVSADLKVPVAIFTANNTSSTAPKDIQFWDNSTGNVSSRSWDFNGDSVEDSTDQNPIYTYTENGNFTVSLTVTNAMGSDTETKTGYIKLSNPYVAPILLTASAALMYLFGRSRRWW